MQILSLVILAIVLGGVHAFIGPKVEAVLPAATPKGRFAQAAISGGIILLSLFAANLILGVFRLRGAKA